MSIRSIGFAAGLALFAAITPASADVLNMTVTGTVSSGADGYGLFGTVGADMTGAQFTAIYSVDLAARNVYIFDGGARDGQDPYLALYSPPAATVVFTINNRSIEFAGSAAWWFTNSAQYVFQSIGFNYGGADTYGVDTQPGTSFGFFADHGERFSLNTQVPLSETPTAAVPEPSTWAMMILGFAGIGFMAYRRKAKPALIAA